MTNRNITIYNEDCIETLKRMDDESVDLILTDPPYDISHGGKRFRGKSADFGKWDHGSVDMDAVIEQYYRVLKWGGTMICFYDFWKIQGLKEIMESKGFRMIRLIDWQKTNPCPIHSDYFYLSGAHEYAIVAVKGNNPVFNSKYDNGVYKYGVARSKFHPTPKNVELFKDLIKKHSNEGDLVMDCFLGSGTTAIAAAQTGRRFVGCELDKGYYTEIVNSMITHCSERKVIFEYKKCA